MKWYHLKVQQSFHLLLDKKYELLVESKAKEYFI